MIPSDQRPPGEDWLVRRIVDLERQVRELQAGRRLEAATVGAGGITIKGGGALRVIDGDGTPVATFGDLASVKGAGTRGVWLQRAGGGPAFGVYGTGPGDEGFVGMYDRSYNYVVTDDAASGRGLARPYIPLQIGDVTSVPTATTTSATFADILAGAAVIQHPVLYTYLLIRASDPTTAGEVHVAVDGMLVGPTVPVPAGTFAYASAGPFAVPSSVLSETYGAVQVVSIQARRTAGTGTIGARVLSLLGLESSYAP